MDRHDGIAVGVVGAIVLIGAGAWWVLSPAGQSEPTEPVHVAPPEPARKPRPAPLAGPRTWSLPRPASAVHEPAPEPVMPAPPGSMTAEETKAFQRSAMAVTKQANNTCMRPWSEFSGTVAEAVMDVVVQDGVVVDVQLRSLTELPADVLDCIGEIAWAEEWPVAVSEGEVRFQNSLAVGRRD